MIYLYSFFSTYNFWLSLGLEWNYNYITVVQEKDEDNVANFDVF